MLITHKLLSLNSAGLQLIDGRVKNQALVKQYSVPRYNKTLWQKLGKTETLLITYHELFSLHLNYGVDIWGNSSKKGIKRTFSLLKKQLDAFANLIQGKFVKKIWKI